MKQREILSIRSKGALRGEVEGCWAYVKYKHLSGKGNDRLLPSDSAASLNFTVCRLRSKEDVLRMIGLA